MHADEARAMKVTPEALDQGYYITVIEEKNVKQRNMLLLGSAAFCIIVALSATVYSLFDKDLGVGAIDSDKLFSAVIVDEPMVVEEQHEQKKKDEDSGGGGGGGKNEPDPVNQGDLADQSPNPSRPPDVKVPRLENPSLMLMPPQTEGPTKKFDKTYGRWGDPNSTLKGSQMDREPAAGSVRELEPGREAAAGREPEAVPAADMAAVTETETETVRARALAADLRRQLGPRLRNRFRSLRSQRQPIQTRPVRTTFREASG
jgi:hypothetical protein